MKVNVLKHMLGRILYRHGEVSQCTLSDCIVLSRPLQGSQKQHKELLLTLQTFLNGIARVKRHP